MKTVNSIITFASWEDRFYLGMEKNIEAYSPEKVIMFFYREYENSTNNNRQKIDKICKSKQIELKPVLVEFEDEAKTWKKFEALFEKDNFNKKNVVVDITTMPELLYTTNFNF